MSETTRSAVQVIAHYYAKPDTADDVLAALTRLAAASRTEPGNRTYEFFRGVEAPEHIVILESYDSQAALDAHRASDHFRSIGVGRIIPMLTERAVIELPTD
ncbi:putative quinol monooxygenase [Gordonia humi]|uniref:Quinol monooxygenase YgiN n=1 Tax=Gordonia humi TaxID=686429 RepID=A0A840F8H8_9ACTN|nr:antibiotic biosynthesis monooxygenase family protein [Gordonia humi]MBB4137889.1 quinol monooxygenase YgiN [Gordonia humi]